MCEDINPAEGLRRNLRIMGYEEYFDMSAVPLVTRLLHDLIRTSEQFRDAKEKADKLFQEKSKWLTIMEPYHCENTRILSECNKLRQEIDKERQEKDAIILELQNQVSRERMEKLNLCDQYRFVEEELKLANKKIEELQAKHAGNVIARKPFISTVRSTPRIPRPESCRACLESGLSNLYKGRANDRFSKLVRDITVRNLEAQLEESNSLIENLRGQIKMRDREIERLTALLAEEGRPFSALIRECCFTGVAELSSDVEQLQRDKTQLKLDLERTRDQMHEAQQRSIELKEKERRLKEELNELRVAAIEVENQANDDARKMQHEQAHLHEEIERLREKITHYEEKMGTASGNRVQEMEEENERLKQETKKLKDLLTSVGADLERNKAKMFKFDKHNKEKIASLKSTIEVQNDEIAVLRTELQQYRQRCEDVISRYEKQDEGRRGERNECEQLKKELENSKKEYEEKINKKYEKIRNLENLVEELKKEIETLKEAHTPRAEEIVRLKTQIEKLSRDLEICDSQNKFLIAKNNELRELQDNTNALLEDAQTNLKKARTQINARLDIAKGALMEEVEQYRAEVNHMRETRDKLEAEVNDLMENVDEKMKKIKQLQEDIMCEKEKHAQIQHEMRQNKENRLVRVGPTASEMAIEENEAKMRTEIIRAEEEVIRLTNLVKHFMLRVDKAENLLQAKEKEREEILEQFRNLSENCTEQNCQHFESSKAKYEEHSQILHQEIAARDEIILNYESKLVEYIEALESIHKECSGTQELVKKTSIHNLLGSELCSVLEAEIEAVRREINLLREMNFKLHEENKTLLSKSQPIIPKNTLNKILLQTHQEFWERVRKVSVETESNGTMDTSKTSENDSKYLHLDIPSDINSDNNTNLDGDSMQQSFEKEEQNRRYSLVQKNISKAKHEHSVCCYDAVVEKASKFDANYFENMLQNMRGRSGTTFYTDDEQNKSLKYEYKYESQQKSYEYSRDDSPDHKKEQPQDWIQEELSDNVPTTSKGVR